MQSMAKRRSDPYADDGGAHECSTEACYRDQAADEGHRTTAARGAYVWTRFVSVLLVALLATLRKIMRGLTREPRMPPRSECGRLEAVASDASPAARTRRRKMGERDCGQKGQEA